MTYAVWAGLGTAGIAVVGSLLLGERLDLVKAAAIGLIIIGVVVLNLHGAHAALLVSGKRQESVQQLAGILDCRVYAPEHPQVLALAAVGDKAGNADHDELCIALRQR